MRIRGSTIVVTGASSGVGREAARRLAARGARVWAVARNRRRLDDLAADQPGITPFAADVSAGADRAALVAAVTAEGPCDALVNNAGVAWAGLVEDMPAGEVRRLFEVNVIGLIDLTQRFLSAMLERRRGHIVNVGSVAGWVAAPPLSVYSATKFAVAGFTEGLRREVQGRGVAVSLVAPGPLATELMPRAQGLATGAEPARASGGLPGGAALAGRAVVAAIRLGAVPGWGSIAVPRVVGLARLGAAPGLARLVDLGALWSRSAPLPARPE